MRTTIELKSEHRSALLALAARRGEKGFSSVIEEAIESYLAGEAEREGRRQTLLSLAGSLSGAGGRGVARGCPGAAGELALILADTDVLIDYLAGVQPVTAEIAGYAANERLQTTAITCFELLSGAGEGKGGKPSANSSAPSRFCRWTGMLPNERLESGENSNGVAAQSGWATA